MPPIHLVEQIWAMEGYFQEQCVASFSAQVYLLK